CSTDCGKGERRRSVQCVSDGGLILRWKECDVTSKPTTSEVCDMGSCVKTWFFSEWTEKCSETCGWGVRTREGTCLDSNQTVSTECEASNRPRLRESCSDADCTTGPVTHREKVESCKDTYDNCDLVVQARLCRYSYYSAACCKTCSEHDHH
ncbi:PREDICTED: ADAMTS-like protein 4, partial [Priapulus caudatus]|uniref:ADAMTS-like protein 4 n=1 Tax=Priapulus caudatus TaxID=37621 RepID=A0ABM1F662_PRICU